MQTMTFIFCKGFVQDLFMQVYTECHLYIGNFVMYNQCMCDCTCCTAVNTMQVIECMGVAAPVLAITTKSAFTDTSSSTRRNWNRFPGQLINHVV